MQDTASKGDRNWIKGATGEWEVVIGLEVHAQVASNAKLFSGASTAFGGAPNSHVSLVDAAMPGMLPVINQACIDQAVRTGYELKGEINPVSVFDRKNYFYPDLPQGYQISQYKSPIVTGGEVVIDVDGEPRKIGIERLHLEQDAGKSIHDQNPEYSYVDLNRSGVALMEIVSKPDMRSAKQAQAFISELRDLLEDIGTCDGDMEKGNLRADVNVSVHRPGTALGTRCEIKNLNSIYFIGQAVEVEARRQIDILEAGGSIEQETRLFDPDRGETRSMRSKEEAHDYRYFPDPDLLPLELTQEYRDRIRAEVRERRAQRLARFRDNFALNADQAHRLARKREIAESFEDLVFEYVALRRGEVARALGVEAYGPKSKRLSESDWALFEKVRSDFEPFHAAMIEGAVSLANIVLGDVFARSNSQGESPAVHMRRLGLPKLVALILDKVINGRIAKDVFEIAWTEGGDPAEIVEKRGLKQVTDTGAIEKAVDAVIAANPDKVADAKANPKAISWFVGQVMKATGGKANPAAVNEVLKKKLGL